MKLPHTLSQLDVHFLIDGVKTTGLKDDPDEPLGMHQESMTSKQYQYLRAFLAWIIAGGKVKDEHVPGYERYKRTFGHGNINERWAEFVADQGKPVPVGTDLSQPGPQNVVEKLVIAPAPDEWELHLSGNTDFTAKGWSKKVKALGGKYNRVSPSACRERFVTLPNNDAGYALAEQLIQNFGNGKVPVIARFKTHNAWPSWVVVQYTVRQAQKPLRGVEADYQRMYRQAVDRKIIQHQG
jgi:hypothetical protein